MPSSILHSKSLKVVIVMPAFNAAKTVHNTYYEIPKYLRKKIILVDDGSNDNTVKIAKKLGIKVFKHTSNLGYGANQKTCYEEALKLNPDIVVMLHPDYQYDASMIEDLIYPIARGRYDFMFGSRIANKKGALAGGMPPLKYYVNRVICLIQNILLGVNFSEHFSGFRAYSRRLIETIPFRHFSNDFVFDQEMTISALNHKFLIGEISIPTRYHQKASSIQFLKGTKFILDGLGVIIRLYLHNLGIIKDIRFLKIKPAIPVSGYTPWIFSAVAVTNLILAGIFQSNLIFGSLLLIASILLYFNYINNLSIKLSSFILLCFLILISLKYGFDNNLFNLSALEADKLVSRHEYFANELGSLYRNKLGIDYVTSIRPILTKFNKNLFSHLDFNLIFNVKNMISLFFIPLFMLGVYNLSKNVSKSLVFYLVVIFTVGGFLSSGTYSYFLYAPLVNLLIFLGLLQILKLKKYVKR